MRAIFVAIFLVLSGAISAQELTEQERLCVESITPALKAEYRNGQAGKYRRRLKAMQVDAVAELKKLMSELQVKSNIEEQIKLMAGMPEANSDKYFELMKSRAKGPFGPALNFVSRYRPDSRGYWRAKQAGHYWNPYSKTFTVTFCVRQHIPEMKGKDLIVCPKLKVQAIKLDSGGYKVAWWVQQNLDKTAMAGRAARVANFSTYSGITHSNGIDFTTYDERSYVDSHIESICKVKVPTKPELVAVYDQGQATQVDASKKNYQGQQAIKASHSSSR